MLAVQTGIGRQDFQPHGGVLLAANPCHDVVQAPANDVDDRALVALTDAWHCAKSLWITCILLASIAPFTRLLRWRWWAWPLVFLGATILYGGIFELFFSKVLAR